MIVSWRIAAYAIVIAMCATAYASTADMAVVIDAALNAPLGESTPIGISTMNWGPDRKVQLTIRYTVPDGLAFDRVAWTLGVAGLCTTPTQGTSGEIVCTTTTQQSALQSTIVVWLTPSVGVSAGTEVTHRATVSANRDDPAPDNNTAFRPMVIGGSADMSVRLSGPTLIENASVYRWTIALENRSAHPVLGTDFKIDFEPFASGATLSQRSGSALMFNSQLFARPERIAPNDAFTFDLDIPVTFPNGLVSAGAKVGSGIPDPDPSNNSVEIEHWLVAQPSDPAIRIGPGFRDTWNNIVFPISIYNNGTGPTGWFKARIEWPSGLAVRVMYSDGSCEKVSDSSVDCSGYSLDPGTSVELFLAVVDRNPPPKFTVRAQVRALPPTDAAEFNIDRGNDDSYMTYPALRRRTVRH